MASGKRPLAPSAGPTHDNVGQPDMHQELVGTRPSHIPSVLVTDAASTLTGSRTRNHSFIACTFGLDANYPDPYLEVWFECAYHEQLPPPDPLDDPLAEAGHVDKDLDSQGYRSTHTGCAKFTSSDNASLRIIRLEDSDTEGKDLNARGTLHIQIDRLIPSSTMQERALEGIDTGDGWPAPRVENSSGVDHKITALLEDGSILLTNLHGPLAFLLFPASPDHLVPKADVAAQVVLVEKIVEVGEDFARRSVVGRPVRFGLKGIRVVVAAVVCTPGVPVLEPGSTNVGVLLVDIQDDIRERVLQLAGQTDARGSISDHDDPHLAVLVDRGFTALGGLNPGGSGIRVTDGHDGNEWMNFSA
ncbi:hypothetical protein PEBR_42241 [Penicillium brasilianum]|uniref:Uncharacterized protein n=1 Tax=Penicillium brasilianum TaxID=104259 RepID=A0A1S9R861_PENBI|nr:hypothetical protein PEBR_42241 [Penicillium brasilianum]